MSPKKTNPKNDHYYRPNHWGMIRDIFTTAMNKGQFPFALVGILMLLLAFKLPEEQVGELVFRILDALRNGSILGWILSGLLLFGWMLNVHHLRKSFTREIGRLAIEKRELQGVLLKHIKAMDKS